MTVVNIIPDEDRLKSRRFHHSMLEILDVDVVYDEQESVLDIGSACTETLCPRLQNTWVKSHRHPRVNLIPYPRVHWMRVQPVRPRCAPSAPRRGRRMTRARGDRATPTNRTALRSPPGTQTAWSGVVVRVRWWRAG